MQQEFLLQQEKILAGFPSVNSAPSVDYHYQPPDPHEQ
jgi:hypothetical protein